MYNVNLWGSKPGENDDCRTGGELTNLKRAIAWLEKEDEKATETCSR